MHLHFYLNDEDQSAVYLVELIIWDARCNFLSIKNRTVCVLNCPRDRSDNTDILTVLRIVEEGKTET